MDGMSTDAIDTVTVTTNAGTFRTTFYYDDDAMSPRDADNVGRITITSRDVVDVDPDSDVDYVLDEVQGGRISVRAACRYLRAALGARVVLPVYVTSYSHSYSTGSPDDQGTRPDGFTYDDSTDPTGCLAAGMTDDDIAEALAGEVAAYGQWAAGEFVWFLTERLDDPDGDADPDDDGPWTEVDSCGSIDDPDYARTLAAETVASFRPRDFPSRALAAQV
jgi:hypothetical protein